MLRYFVLLLIALFGANATVTGEFDENAISALDTVVCHQRYEYYRRLMPAETLPDKSWIQNVRFHIRNNVQLRCTRWSGPTGYLQERR